MVSVPFNEGEVYGNTLVTGVIKEGDPYIRITLRDPINVALIPRHSTKSPGSIRVKRYREVDFRYIDFPLKGKEDKFEFQKTKQDDIWIKNVKGDNSFLFIPASSILSIDVRESLPGKKYLRWKSVKSRLRKYVKRVAYILGFTVGVL